MEITIFRLWVVPITHSLFFGVYPLAQGGGSLLGICGAESICPRPHQRERRAAAGRVRSGHRGLKDQRETPVPLQRRHRLRQTQVRYLLMYISAYIRYSQECVCKISFYS